jgi:hypothetical protein
VFAPELASFRGVTDQSDFEPRYNAYLAKVASGEFTPTVTVGVYADRGRWPPDWRQTALVREGGHWHASRPEAHLDRHPLLNTNPELKPGSDAMTHIVAFLLATGAFVAEHLLADEPEPPDRAARRRAERARERPPDDVHVLNFRRVERNSDKRESHRDVDWSCRWVVGSHWRQQYHPSDGSHSLKWIRPYLKGPADKPLRVSSPTVRAIVR